MSIIANNSLLSFSGEMGKTDFSKLGNRLGASSVYVTDSDSSLTGLYIVCGGVYTSGELPEYIDWSVKRIKISDGSVTTLAYFPKEYSSTYGRVGGTLILFNHGIYGNVLFYGFGLNYAGSETKDWWMYNISTDSWIQLKDLPTVTSFSEAYVYNGYIHVVAKSAIYKYNHLTDNWTTISATPISNFSSFKINNYIYIIEKNIMIMTWTEYTGYLYFDTRVYQYNLITNSWAQKNDFPNIYVNGDLILNTRGGGAIVKEVNAIINPHTFTTNSTNLKGYVGLGRVQYYEVGYTTPNNEYLNFFYEYDQSSDSWSKVDKSFVVKHYGQGIVFDYNDKIYIGLGKYQTNTYPAYDPPIDFWHKIICFIP